MRSLRPSSNPGASGCPSRPFWLPLLVVLAMILPAAAAAEPSSLGQSVAEDGPAGEPEAERGDSAIPVTDLDEEGEVFRYRWRFTSMLGRLVGLFLPSRGDGVLSFVPQGADLLESRLEITSDEADSDEFWLYAAYMDRETGRTKKAWSDYKYRGESKRKESEIGETGVFDIASAIYRIRQRPPRSATRLKIWSDGKVYPVEVIPGPTQRFEVGEGKITARSYRVVGVEEPGARFWKGRLNLWLSLDEGATPVVIEVERSALTVRLELVPEATAAAR